VTIEWTHLPKCERRSGFGAKLAICVGCEGYTLLGSIPIFVILERLGMSWMEPLSRHVAINTIQSA
jgi:hypothetical protein